MNTMVVVALGAVAAGFVQGLSGFAFRTGGHVLLEAWSLDPRLSAALAVFRVR